MLDEVAPVVGFTQLDRDHRTAGNAEAQILHLHEGFVYVGTHLVQDFLLIGASVANPGEFVGNAVFRGEFLFFLRCFCWGGALCGIIPRHADGERDGLFGVRLYGGYVGLVSPVLILGFQQGIRRLQAVFVARPPLGLHQDARSRRAFIGLHRDGYFLVGGLAQSDLVIVRHLLPCSQRAPLRRRNHRNGPAARERSLRDIHRDGSLRNSTAFFGDPGFCHFLLRDGRGIFLVFLFRGCLAGRNHCRASHQQDISFHKIFVIS